MTIAWSRRRLLAALPALAVVAASCGPTRVGVAQWLFPTATPQPDRHVRIVTHNRPAGLWAGNVVTAAARRLPLERKLAFDVLPLNPTTPGVPPAVSNAFATWPSVYAAQLGTLSGESVPDLVVVDSRWLAACARADVLVDVGPLIRAESWFDQKAYGGDVLAAGRARGRQLALPLALWVDGMLHDTTALRGANQKASRPDWGWPDLLATAQALTRPGKWGLALDREPPSAALWTLGWQRGASIVAREGTGLRLDEPGLLDALGYLAELVQRHRVAAAIEADPPSVLELMAQRQAAMLGTVLGVSIAWSQPRFKDFVPATWPIGERPGQDGAFAYAPLMVGIPRNAPRRDLSVEALGALATTVPDAALLPAGKRIAGGAPGIADQLSPEDVVALDRARAAARFLPGEFPLFAVQQILDEELLLPVLSGRKRPDQAAADARAAADRRLADYAR